MDLALDGDPRAWHDAAAAFAAAELNDPDDVRRRDEARAWSADGYRACARFGVTGLPVPEEYGGRGKDLVTAVAAVEGLGYGCPDTGLLFALSACLWTVTLPVL